MNRFRVIALTLLILSVVANGWLGFSVYKNSRVLQMQSASYDSFKSLLAAAMKETDAATIDPPGSVAQKNHVDSANISLVRAMGLIMGLRTDFAKKGMDIYPIFVALGQSENPSPYEASFSETKAQNTIFTNSKTLHDVFSVLASTSFTNTGLSKLQLAVTELDGKYPGYPSYSSLQ